MPGENVPFYWEAVFDEWYAAHRDQQSTPQEKGARLETLRRWARTEILSCTSSSREWLLAVLDGATEAAQRRRYFLSELLRTKGLVPKALLKPMLRAAVYERNPSFNRGFIEPCLRSATRRVVNEELLRYLEQGTNREKAGAANAFYWSLGLPIENDEDINDLHRRIRNRLLIEFVQNDDIDIRRCIIPRLRFDADLYPEELHPLLPQAIAIARSHPDTYIRHRVEIQLDSNELYLPLPTINF